MRRFLLGLVTIVCFCFPLAAQAQPSVLVISSYHTGYMWDADYRRGLKAELEPAYKLSFFEMDTKRLPPSLHAAKADEAWALYQKMKPDLVVLGDDAALRYLADRFSVGKTPVVYLGINNNPRAYLALRSDVFTGVLERPLLKRSIVYIKRILPQVNRVLVLFDADVTSDIVIKETFDGLPSQTFYGVTAYFQKVRSLEEWKQAVLGAKEKGYDAMVVGLYQTIRDQNGHVVNSEALVEWLSENTQIPPFAFWDFAIGPNRALGGFVLSGYDMGVQAAGIAKDILQKKVLPKDLPPAYSEEGHFVFSRTQLERWKIALPYEIEKASMFVEDRAKDLKAAPP